MFFLMREARDCYLQNVGLSAIICQFVTSSVTHAKCDPSRTCSCHLGALTWSSVIRSHQTVASNQTKHNRAQHEAHQDSPCLIFFNMLRTARLAAWRASRSQIKLRIPRPVMVSWIRLDCLFVQIRLIIVKSAPDKTNLIYSSSVPSRPSRCIKVGWPMLTPIDPMIRDSSMTCSTGESVSNNRGSGRMLRRGCDSRIASGLPLSQT